MIILKIIQQKIDQFDSLEKISDIMTLVDLIPLIEKDLWKYIKRQFFIILLKFESQPEQINYLNNGKFIRILTLLEKFFQRFVFIENSQGQFNRNYISFDEKDLNKFINSYEISV